MIANANNDDVTPVRFRVKIKRQDAPGKPGYWETHQVEYEENMNVISVLQRIAANAKTAEGKAVAPVAWDCGCLEEVCGSCTMIINGKVRQSCSALVANLLRVQPDEITLEPMSKFPVQRDLVVSRKRAFQALQKVKAWVPVDSYVDMGPGEKQSRSEQEKSYPLSQCMTCGCCLEACPQYTKIEVIQKDGESDADFEKRQMEANDEGFIGAHAINQAMLFNKNPTGKFSKGERLDALTDQGGIQMCGNAQNCVAVCPKEIPLTTSIAQAGRAVTVHQIKKWFDS